LPAIVDRMLCPIRGCHVLGHLIPLNILPLGYKRSGAALDKGLPCSKWPRHFVREPNEVSMTRTDKGTNRRSLIIW